MTDGDASSLVALEQYIAELFSGAATNQRLQRIHEALDAFSRQKGAWRDCLYFLNHTSKNETAMYCLTVLEGFITKGWGGLTSSEQKQLLDTLYHWIREKHHLVPFFIRNKAVQLVVHVARSDWPSKYPEFYNDILQLISSPDPSCAVLGLLFLQTASEELGTPRDDLLSARKAELKQQLLRLVPDTLSVLSGLLETIWENKTHSITSTPPPSPTQVLPSSHSSSSGHFSTASRGKGGGGGGLNAELEPVARAALQCLSQIFSWIPLSTHVTPHLMELVFRFVAMGTQPCGLPPPAGEAAGGGGVAVPVPVAALAAVNEVLYKNCVPVQFEDFVVLLFNNACIILHHLIDGTKNTHLPQTVHPQFVDKFLELIHLLVSHHLRRLEGRNLSVFSVPQFLSLFFGLTFEQDDWHRYTTCLETWQVFLDYLKQAPSTSTSSSSSSSTGYFESLTTLSERVLHRMLFADNAAQLQLLDDQGQDGDMETEWQKVLRQSIEIFVTAGEIVNNQTLSILNEPFERCASALQSLASLSSGGVVRVESKSQLKEMLAVFRDLATLLQLIGRLCELHTGKDYQHHLNIGKSLVQRLLDLASCSTAAAKTKFVGCTDPELESTLTQVHAHCLSALHAWCHWISLWLAKNPSQADALVGALVTAASGVLAPDYCAPTAAAAANGGPNAAADGVETPRCSVYRASLQLLSAVVAVVRSPCLWRSPTWLQLFDSVHDMTYLPPIVLRQLRRCVLGSALVSWRGCAGEEQRWEERKHRLRAAVDRASRGAGLLFQQLAESTAAATADSAAGVRAKDDVLATLVLLADLAALVKDENTASKSVLAAVLAPSTEPTLILLSYYVHDHQVTEAVFDFYLAVFDGLLNQMGVACAQKAVHTFLQTFTQHNIQVTLQQENSHGIRAIERFLRILQIVVQEPGAAFKHFLPSTLTLILDHIYPCIAQVPSSDLKETFYQLLTLILRHNWRYFFKGSVLKTYGSREADRSEQVDHQVQFMSIMAAYGQSFLLPDINIFQQNLQALDSLQSKWKLYHKAIFRDTVAGQFINTLLSVLANGSHELLREEMGLSVYAMASPDLDGFFQTLLPCFLVNSQGIDDHQRLALKNNFSSDTDLPSFTQNVHRLTNDLRCYRFANVSRANLYQS